MDSYGNGPGRQCPADVRRMPWLCSPWRGSIERIGTKNLPQRKIEGREMIRKALVTMFLMTLLALFAGTFPASAGVGESAFASSSQVTSAPQNALLASCSSTPPPWWYNYSTAFTGTNNCNKCIEMGKVWNASGYQAYCWEVSDYRVELWLYHP
ncbi:hypothetical protein [Nonomuraea sp. NPDC048901]|uniref:hypothetical protein n=1 Tax=Nonomuraea sp. NPDC048901 TaxID=3155627 RepID=UPI0033FB0484